MAAKMIGSRSWGLFFGLADADLDHQLDGNLVLGEYDAGNITGENVTLSFTKNSGCPSGLIIDVMDISVGLMNGSSFPILGTSQSSALTVCLEPHSTLIDFPLDVYKTFLGIAGGTLAGGSDSGRSNSPFAFFGELFEAAGV